MAERYRGRDVKCAVAAKVGLVLSLALSVAACSSNSDSARAKSNNPGLGRKRLPHPASPQLPTTTEAIPSQPGYSEPGIISAYTNPALLKRVGCSITNLSLNTSPTTNQTNVKVALPPNRQSGTAFVLYDRPGIGITVVNGGVTYVTVNGVTKPDINIESARLPYSPTVPFGEAADVDFSQPSQKVTIAVDALNDHSQSAGIVYCPTPPGLNT